ncbi:MAG TPA: hypothetical protein VFY96_17320 [Candidatus Binatia bacterium]|nr:hypothetical protein [Candidatus Binatia bacterium]
MEISLKVGSREYDQLRTHVPDGSTAREAVERATRIDYSVGGVLFEGYTIVCDEDAARGLQETAAHYCPEIVAKIQEAVRLARSGQT